jgi:hypothetical protein
MTDADEHAPCHLNAAIVARACDEWLRKREQGYAKRQDERKEKMLKSHARRRTEKESQLESNNKDDATNQGTNESDSH